MDSANADNERDESNDYDLTGYEGEECDTGDAPRSSSEDDSKDPPSANLSNSVTLGFPPSPRPSLPSTMSGAALVPSHLIQSLKRKSPPAPAEVDEPSSKKLRQKETSKSAQSEARSRAEADQGIVHLRNFYRFKSKIRILDPYAEFLINDNPRFVRHSECANVIRMKAAGNTTNFKQHLKRCKGPTASTTYIPLLNFPFPCPGLTPERDERIRTYLVRSQTAGGGSPSRPAIAQDLFGTSYKEHQQIDRLAVALSVRFGLSAGFPNPLWRCIAVALLRDAGALGRCDKVGVYFRLLGQSRSEVADVREFGLSKNVTRRFCSVPLSPPTKSPNQSLSTLCPRAQWLSLG